MTDKHWQLQSSQTLIDEPWFRVYKEHLLMPHGTELTDYYRCEESSWSCAVPVLPDGSFVIVEQYRRGVDIVTWEFPAGNLNSDEDPAVAVLRELQEETGYLHSGEPIPLQSLWQSPSRNNATGHAWIIPVHAEPGPCNQEEDEDINILCLSREELLTGLKDGRFRHACHVAWLWEAFGILDKNNTAVP